MTLTAVKGAVIRRTSRALMSVTSIGAVSVLGAARWGAPPGSIPIYATVLPDGMHRVASLRRVNLEAGGPRGVEDGRELPYVTTFSSSLPAKLTLCRDGSSLVPARMGWHNEAGNEKKSLADFHFRFECSYDAAVRVERHSHC
jgi:hypothetical protein